MTEATAVRPTPPTDTASPAPPIADAAPPGKPIWWRRSGVRGTLAVIGVLVLVVVLTLLAADRSSGGDLDPRSAQPSGTLALAELLRHRGIDSSLGALPKPGGTLVVPFAGELPPDDLDRVLSSASGASRVILLAPGDLPESDIKESALPGVSTRAPDCTLPAAVTAGPAVLGDHRYSGGSSSCYGGSLVEARHGATPLVLLGSTTFLTNDALDRQGNAALALGLFSGEGLTGPLSTSVVWYVPKLDPQAQRQSVIHLLPKGVPWAVLQLVLAVGLFALWRGRRLGPVVEEPLPVVVPAAETVEGRARLYAAGRARTAAADALRGGARARLGGMLEQGGEPEANGLIASVAQRAGRQPGEVATLLYGSAGPRNAPGATGGPPGSSAASVADDAALIRLADDIDQLEREVRGR